MKKEIRKQNGREKEEWKERQELKPGTSSQNPEFKFTYRQKANTSLILST